MKRNYLLVIGLLVIATSAFAKKKVESPQVIVIGIGAKNATFNEAQYPDLKFYYTPGLVSQAQVSDGTKSALALSGGARESFSGDPKFLADANDAHELKNCYFIFDKNGVCYSQGYNLGKRGILETTGIDSKKVEDVFGEVLKKEKTAKENSKEMKLKKQDFMLGYKMPEFNVAGVDGSEVSIKSITESGKPIMIVFFQLPKDSDTQEAKQSSEGKSGKAFGKSMLAAAAGSSASNIFVNLESELYDYDAREK